VAVARARLAACHIARQALAQLYPLLHHCAERGFIALLVDQLLGHLLVLGRSRSPVRVLPLGRHAANTTWLHTGKGSGLSQHRRRHVQDRRQGNQPQGHSRVSARSEVCETCNA
jgi:hypothetical protein